MCIKCAAAYFITQKILIFCYHMCSEILGSFKLKYHGTNVSFPHTKITTFTIYQILHYNHRQFMILIKNHTNLHIHVHVPAIIHIQSFPEFGKT